MQDSPGFPGEKVAGALVEADDGHILVDETGRRRHGVEKGADHFGKEFVKSVHRFRLQREGIQDRA